MVPDMELGVYTTQSHIMWMLTLVSSEMCRRALKAVSHFKGTNRANHLWQLALAPGDGGDACSPPFRSYLSLGGREALDLALYGGVRASRVATQQSLAVHLRLEAGDVAAAEVLTQVAHLLQLQQVDPQHLDGFHHLQVGGVKNTKRFTAALTLRISTLRSDFVSFPLLSSLSSGCCQTKSCCFQVSDIPERLTCYLLHTH